MKVEVKVEVIAANLTTVATATPIIDGAIEPPLARAQAAAGKPPQKPVELATSIPNVVENVALVPPVSVPDRLTLPPVEPAKPYPDLRQDPARLAQIKACVQHIGDHAPLPLVRRGGVLALHPASLFDPMLQTIDRFDGDHAIQAAFEESWWVMTMQLGAKLRAPGASPFEPGDVPVVRRGVLKKDLEKAYRIVADDPVVSALVEAGWRERTARERAEVDAARERKLREAARKAAKQAVDTKFWQTPRPDWTERGQDEFLAFMDKVFDAFVAGDLGIDRDGDQFRFQATSGDLEDTSRRLLKGPWGHIVLNALCTMVDADPLLGSALPVRWMVPRHDPQAAALRGTEGRLAPDHRGGGGRE